MKAWMILPWFAALMLAISSHAHGDSEGRTGTIKFSDGRSVTGALSLSPGKDLRIYVGTVPVTLSLSQVKTARFKVEKEEMRQGFYFPNAGQATQAKTDDVYPIRSLVVELALADGRTVTGHLLTTTLYLENDDGTQKIVLLAKMTGQNGQKISDLVYVTDIEFTVSSQPTALVQIDLGQAGLTTPNAPVFFTRPDLAILPAASIEKTAKWNVPAIQPGEILFSVEAANGIHVAWPAATPTDAAIAPAVETGFVNLHDFFDEHEVLSNIVDDDNIYSLVMLKRHGATDSFSAGKVSWSLVALRWKYDAEHKKVTLLNRINLAAGRAEGKAPIPAVLIQPELLRAISVKEKP